MKKVNVENAVGMKLCHDITVIRDDFKGIAFKKNHVITRKDVSALLDIGKRHIFVWEENKKELHEDDAAIRIANMVSIEESYYDRPAEGKVILKSKVAGVFRVNIELINKLNAIEDITIATLPDHYPVEIDTSIASMRIVPLVITEKNIVKAEDLCKGQTLFDLWPYLRRKVGIIITGSEVYNGRIQDKFEPVIRKKLEKYPCEILGVTVCDDRLDMLIDEANNYFELGVDFLILTGGMSVDPDDLTPTAVKDIGAEIVTHGVPAQPGNMTLVAYKKDIAIVGVPGGAIKVPVTVFDAILPQIFCGKKLTKKDMLNLGEGGFCQQCKICHFPNCTFGRY